MLALSNEKTNKEHLFSVGYDSVERYVLALTITYASIYERYYHITAEEYEWFDSYPERLATLAEECFHGGICSPRFICSGLLEENTNEQLKKLRIGERF